MTRDDDIAAEMAQLYRLQAAGMRMVLGLYRANEAADPLFMGWVFRRDEDSGDIDRVIAQMPVEDVRIVARELAEALADALARMNPADDDSHIQWVEERIKFLLDRAEDPLGGPRASGQ